MNLYTKESSNTLFFRRLCVCLLLCLALVFLGGPLTAQTALISSEAHAGLSSEFQQQDLNIEVIQIIAKTKNDDLSGFCAFKLSTVFKLEEFSK